MSTIYAILETVGGRSSLNPDAAPPRSLADAVREHLVVLLNTRAGALPHLPLYGMPDLSAYYDRFPDSLKDLAEDIARAIRLYEPRLLDAKVELTSTSSTHFEASFTIKGWLDPDDEEDQRVKFRTVVDGNGSVKVKI